jgi:hypothetical protein
MQTCSALANLNERETMPAPTIGGNRPTAVASQAAPVVVVPFTRASRKKSRSAGQIGPITLNTTVQGLSPIQLPAAGFLRRLRLTVSGVAAGNSAAVAFKADAPYSILQQISLLSANGDTLISTIDGFTLAMLNKYGAFASGRVDPVADPNYTATTGTGATGGSFSFNLNVPIELDSRDAFCALQNMAANQSFLLQLSLNSIAGIYSTAPTAAPAITITAVMEYWSAPADHNANGDIQAIAPAGLGSVSLIQTQTPTIAPSTQQNIQLLNVGNTVRFAMFILRDAAGARTETDFPATANVYVNGDPWYYKTKAQWRSQMAQEYGFAAGLSATPALGTLDNGVFVLTDFMNDGSSGAGRVDASSNRNEYLVTGSATALNFEAVSWGASASSLLIVENVVRPASPAAMYQPNWI